MCEVLPLLIQPSSLNLCLVDVAADSMVKYIDYTGSIFEKLRLAEMGCVPGILLKLTSNSGRNPIVVGINGVQLIISRVLARKIIVKLVA